MKKIIGGIALLGIAAYVYTQYANSSNDNYVEVKSEEDPVIIDPSPDTPDLPIEKGFSEKGFNDTWLNENTLPNGNGNIDPWSSGDNLDPYWDDRVIY
jgi:hypothetical protein